jgi:hypothetical protein
MAFQMLTVMIPGLRSLPGTASVGLIDALVAVTGAALPLLINEKIKTADQQDSSQDKQSA